jgi:uncharacterized protein YtpQ (UPF0354 family)
MFDLVYDKLNNRSPFTKEERVKRITVDIRVKTALAKISNQEKVIDELLHDLEKGCGSFKEGIDLLADKNKFTSLMKSIQVTHVNLIYAVNSSNIA